MHRLGLTLTITCCALLIVTALPFAQARPTDRDIYEQFRAWVVKQPPTPLQQTSDSTKQPDRLAQYREVLRERGVAPDEIDRQIKVINEQGRALEIERWNVILTAPTPRFNTAPNDFLVEIAKTRKPGRALDVGMGQGRNAIYLAQQGWTVTGFDHCPRARARNGPGLATFTGSRKVPSPRSFPEVTRRLPR